MPKSKKKPKAPPHLRLTCPRIQYGDRTDDLAGHLSRLPPDEGEALVARLVEKNSRCPEASCDCLSPEQLRYELAGAAWNRGDYESCQRHDPDFYHMLSSCGDDEPRRYEDEWYDDPYDYLREDLPIVGVLSRGPVQLCGPQVYYNGCCLKFAQHLSDLPPAEGEELIDFLCTVRDLEWADEMREELCFRADHRGDREMWARQRAKHSRPDSIWNSAELEQRLTEQLSGG